MAVLAGIDFFTVEVLTCRGPVTYYVLSLFTWRVGGSAWQELRDTRQGPDGADRAQRNGRELRSPGAPALCALRSGHEVRASFRTTLAAGGIRPVQLPARSPNLNAFAERWLRSVKQECLSKLILIGEASLRRALGEFVEHFHTERNH